ncbi:hypothetical protein [Corynebacterium sp.]|uniref:hypothetical protein n=1 Tax=Corynebacterium sp. TaxID=1720 RepID=UPI0028AAC7AE|nr:hypothetical protein [Corynebacterium sp.]
MTGTATADEAGDGSGPLSYRGRTGCPPPPSPGQETTMITRVLAHCTVSDLDRVVFFGT